MGLGGVRMGASVLAVVVLLAVAPAARAHIIGIPQIGNSTCAVCVNFVTTSDLDGPGGRAPVTLWHPNLVANVPYAIDVDGGNSPLPIGVLPIVPMYDLRVLVQAVDSAKPRITIERLANAPLSLPVRIELANGDASGWTTLGYDALETSAPQSFVANVDLSDRDGIAATSQALVNVTLGGVIGNRLTLVTEDFTGDPAGTRSDRAIRRLQLSGTGTRTRVPGSFGLDLTATATRQDLVLTRDVLTRLDFEVTSAGGDPRTTGFIDELPARTQVVIDEPDLNGDSEPDTKIDYAAAAVVPTAFIRHEAGDRDTRATIRQLPSDAHLTLATTATRTDITYRANGRAQEALIDTDDRAKKQRLTVLGTNLPRTITELSRVTNADGGTLKYLSDGRASAVNVVVDDYSKAAKNTLTADVTNLPANITELTDSARSDGGRIVYRSDASADFARVRTHKGDARLDARVTSVPAVVERLDHSNTESGFALDYAASAAVPLVEVRTEDVIGDPGSTHRRVLDTRAETVPPAVLLHINKDSTFDYTAAGGVGLVKVVGTDEQPFFSRATNLDLLLTGLPGGADARFKDGDMLFDARGGQLGLAQVLAHDGTPLTLTDADGLLLRDVAGDYNLYARVQGLRSFSFAKAANETAVAFDARSPSDRKIKVDSVRDVRDSLYFNEELVEGTRVRRHISRDGTETIAGELSNLPPDIHVSIGQERGAKDILYTAEGAATYFALNRKVRYRGDPVPVVHDDPYVAARLPSSYPPSDFDSEQDVDLFPVPVSFQLCRYNATNDCTEDVFTDGMLEDYDSEEANKGSLRIRSTPRTNFALLDLKTERGEFSWARDIDAEPECPAEQQVLIVCLGAGFKPVVSESVIVADMREFALQAAQDSSGAVGHVIGKTSQGYLALDTGWASNPVSGCDIVGDVSGCQFFHGHYEPPNEARFSGRITASARDTVSERNADYSDFLGIGPKASPLAFHFQHNFAADHRVFEGDPDELIFAKHWHGHIYCGDALSLNTGGTSFKDFMCDNEIELGPEPVSP